METELTKITTPAGVTEEREKIKRPVDPALISCMVTFEYTGDGTTDNGVTGIGGKPRYLRLWKKLATEDNQVIFETSTEYITAHANGMANIIQDSGAAEIIGSREGRIKSLDADGFTVSDGGADLSPNKLDQDYCGVCYF